ncbi:MAG: Rne/Rng family ribonuclease, partial [Proteobacteria bacterium]|nr:Rne/Rng family ribonuclease [Pseudomonadota bacterium]
PVMVQVTREAVDNKGAALTTNISLPGRFMVLMPHSDKGGVSRKIEDGAERDRLKAFLSGIQSEEHAVIIRTAGVGRSLIELKKDYTILKRTWENIKDTFDETDKPGLVHEEDDVVIRTLRDYYSEDIEEIWVDNPETFQKSLEFMKDVAPRRQNDLKLFVDERSLFATYHIEKQVEQLTSRSVALKSGGSIVIDQTEALVAIDVNSGRSNQERNNDDTAQRTNLEAAEEVLRQLRLRNLGGLIVIDFIDMETDKARKKVENVLHEGKPRDKAKLSFSEISKFGLIEMSRQRLSVGISRTVESACPTCDGKGTIPTQMAATNLIIRCIREIAAKGNVLRVEAELPLELANHLHNIRRDSIMDLELEFGITIHLVANPTQIVFDESNIKTIFKRRKSTVKMDSFPEPIKQEKGKKKGQKKESTSMDESKALEVKSTDSTEKKDVPSTPKEEKVNDEVKIEQKHQRKK